MANITRPTVERHSCDIKGCDSLAENPLYWNVSFPIIANDNYDDGSYFGGTRTRIINRSIDLCDYHASILLALHGEHTSNYGNAWTDDGPELQAHDARREQTEERQVMTEENDLPNLTTGEWMALFHMVKTTKYIALVYPHALPLLVGKGLADVAITGSSSLWPRRNGNATPPTRKSPASSPLSLARRTSGSWLTSAMTSSISEGNILTLRKRWRQYPKAWRHLRSAVV